MKIRICNDISLNSGWATKPMERVLNTVVPKHGGVNHTVERINGAMRTVTVVTCASKERHDYLVGELQDAKMCFMRDQDTHWTWILNREFHPTLKDQEAAAAVAAAEKAAAAKREEEEAHRRALKKAEDEARARSEAALAEERSKVASNKAGDEAKKAKAARKDARKTAKK